MAGGEYTSITAERWTADERIFQIHLDSPETDNVLNGQMTRDLIDAFQQTDQDEAIDGILLGTTHDKFSMGGDVSELEDMSHEDAVKWLESYWGLLELIRKTGKPVIASVVGPCVAGGNELTIACDLVIAGESAKFGQPEVNVGSTAAAGAVQMLPLIVGKKRAMEILLTGDPLSAEEAREFGLINRVVPDDEVDRHALELLQSILDTKNAQAYRTIKSIMKQWDNNAHASWEITRELTAAVWGTDKFGDRARSFLKGETPPAQTFSGITEQDDSS